MSLLHTTENPLNTDHSHTGNFHRVSRVLHVALLVLGVFWVAGESRACDLCGFQECWFIEDTNVISTDFPGGLGDHQHVGTSWRDDHESPARLTLDDMLFLLDLLDAIDGTSGLPWLTIVDSPETDNRRGLSPVRVNKAGTVQADRGIVVGNPADTLLDPGAELRHGIVGSLSRENKRRERRR